MGDSILTEFNRRRIAFENAFFSLLRKISLPVARVAFFTVFFWFGVLKMMELSPSGNVVHTIYEHTAWFIPWKLFILTFGAYECIIGIIFLFPGREKWALYMLIPHAITTFAPLVLLPALAWKQPLVPNLIGQYIIKNMVIISLAIFIAIMESENRMKKKEHAEGVLQQVMIPVKEVV